MKRGVTREDIIRTTQSLITRNGIRAVRVDEIVQSLGISKRTLYETFADKEALVKACIDNMQQRLHKRVVNRRTQYEGNPLQYLIELADTYIDDLYATDCSFITDISHKIDYVEMFTEYRTLWQGELGRACEACRNAELLLADVQPKRFAEILMNVMLQLRLNMATRREAYRLNRTILRGAATRSGIEWIDSNLTMS